MVDCRFLTQQMIFIYIVSVCLITLTLIYLKGRLVSDVYGWRMIGFYPFVAAMFLIELAWAILNAADVRCHWLTLCAYFYTCGILVFSGPLWLQWVVRSLGYRNRPRSKRLMFLSWLVAVLAFGLVLRSFQLEDLEAVASTGAFVCRVHHGWVYFVCLGYCLVASALCLLRTAQSDDPVDRRLTLALFLVPFPLAFSILLQMVTSFGFLSIGVVLTVAIWEMDRQRRAMDAAIESERSRGMIFNLISHEIRTPLNAIVGFAELLKDGAKDEADSERMHTAIKSASQRLLGLVNDVLDESKIASDAFELHPVPTRLNEVVSRACSLLSSVADRRGLSISTEVAEMPALMIDSHRVEQILLNLISNGLKFTPKGFVQIKVGYADGCLTLSVSDTGIGMSAEEVEALLSPYYKLRRTAVRFGSIGLGISICRRLIDRMKGSLTVTSKPGEGSTFTVRLPCEAVASAPDEEGPASPGRRRSILVVDDMTLNLKLMVRMLEQLEVTNIDTAANGKIARMMLLERGRAYDLVLTDLQMPEMDGIELVRAIRADPVFRDLPVYVISGDELDDPQKLGFTGALQKPVTVESLSRVVFSRGPSR